MPCRDKGHIGQLTSVKGELQENHFGVFGMVITEGCTKEITFGQRHEQREGMGHVKV